jgi:hypothetical protein
MFLQGNMSSADPSVRHADKLLLRLGRTKCQSWDVPQEENVDSGSGSRVGGNGVEGRGT